MNNRMPNTHPVVLVEERVGNYSMERRALGTVDIIDSVVIVAEAEKGWIDDGHRHSFLAPEPPSAARRV